MATKLVKTWERALFSAVALTLAAACREPAKEAAQAPKKEAAPAPGAEAEVRGGIPVRKNLSSLFAVLMM
ncbi:MAG: hypothetical protein ACRD1B_12295, partial [Thermoanaerobaculia bacterium]